MTTSREYEKGFLIVATLHPWYKNNALVLIDSLDEYYPDCKIFVVTHKEWKSQFEEYDQVVKILTEDDGMPISERTKLWGLKHTPFDKTCYLDADMEVVRDEISEVWKLLDEDHDVAFTVINPDTGASTAIYKEEGEEGIRDNNAERHLRYHGGFFLWNNTDTANKAMDLWWDRYVEINLKSQWWKDHPEYYLMNRGWDQFTLWWIFKHDTPDIKVQEVEHGQAKWNWNIYMKMELTENIDPVIIHHPLDREKMKQAGDKIAKNTHKWDDIGEDST